MAQGQVIAKVETFPISIKYDKPIRWDEATDELSADYVLLKLTTRDGIVGVAEGTVKLRWTAATMRTLVNNIDEIFTPLLIGLDVDDETALRKVWGFHEHSFIKAMIDIAIWDIRSQVAGQPLWRMWGGDRDVAVTWCLTRKPPAEMAREAEHFRKVYGITALKLKGGQGIEVDRAALDAVRSAVGDDVRIYVDSNGAYTEQQVCAYAQMAGERGVAMLEDPCPFLPNAAFEELQKACSLPILVDYPCRDLAMAKLFIERKARALNLKLQKARGYTENWEIATYALSHGCDVNLGLLAETSLGSQAAFQLGARLPTRLMPAENTLFLILPHEYVHEPLHVANGKVTLSDKAGFVSLVDWKAVERLRP